MRIELMTPSLPRKCSTPELRRQTQFAVGSLQVATNGTANCYMQTVNWNERKTRLELATWSLEGYRSTKWATSADQFADVLIC